MSMTTVSSEHRHLVRNPSRDLHHFARPDDDLAVVELKPERAGQDAADLLVLMRVRRHDATLLEAPTSPP